MFRRSLVAVVIALTVPATLIGVACANASSPSASSSPTDGPLQADGPPPDEVLAASRESFAKVESFRIRFDVDFESLDGSMEGEAGYRSGDVVYSQTVYEGVLEEGSGIGEALLIPPDLYINTSDGRWFVMSPWNQGIRPDELPEAGLDEPLLDYDGFVGALSEIERLPDETIDGAEYLRYGAAVDINDLPTFAPPEGSSAESTRADVWLHRGSYLPYKVKIDADLSGEESFVVTIEFLDHDRPMTTPERPSDARPIRDLQLPEAPCTGSLFAACLEAQTDLRVPTQESCEGAGKRVCLVPLGQVSPALIEHLVTYYRDQYGLSVVVLTPSAVPASLANPLREQIDASTLVDYMGSLFPDSLRDLDAILIGLTPIDMYDSTSHFRYLFALRRTAGYPSGVISTFRMNTETYGEPFDEELVFSRTRKFLTKYVGLLIYKLPTSADPRSPMFDNILGTDDLDMMEEPLPVVAAR